MTGFTNADGSLLVGGLNPAGQGQGLSCDAAGKLNVNAGIAQINGSALTPGNPLITETNIQNWIRAGNGFNVTTGAQQNATAGNYAFSFFNPASAKNILVFSIRVMTGSGNIFTIQSTTSAPTLSGSQAAAFYNLSNAATANVASGAYSTTAGIPSGGTTFDVAMLPVQLEMAEVLSNGATILLPASTNNGLLFYTYANANVTWSVTLRYIQF